MVLSKEDMNVDEGIIRVGATGIVYDLMRQELDSIRRKSQSTSSSPNKLQTVPVSVYCGVSTKRVQPRRISSHNTRISGSMSNTNYKRPGSIQRKKNSTQHNIHHIPMLRSEDVCMDRTQDRGKPGKKGSHIVEIVDLKCGSSVRASSSPVSNQLRRLSFSRLSD